MAAATDNTQRDAGKGLTENAGGVTLVTQLLLSHLTRFSTMGQVRILIRVQLFNNF